MIVNASCSKADGVPPPLKQRHPYICRPSHLFQRQAPEIVPRVRSACGPKDSLCISPRFHAQVVSHDNLSDTLVTAWAPTGAIYPANRHTSQFQARCNNVTLCDFLSSHIADAPMKEQVRPCRPRGAHDPFAVCLHIFVHRRLGERGCVLLFNSSRARARRRFSAHEAGSRGRG